VDEHQVDGLSVGDARALLEALESVTVVDPACGSGAYLLGMLHELIELQRLLYSARLLADAQSLYDLKLRIIQNNLYGADIDPFAVNIAMLRLWLSLAIEFNDPTSPPPALPNLDFKIVRGDSLTAPNPSPSLQPDLFRTAAHAIADEIATLKGEHMRATGDTKRTLADQIAQKQGELRAVLGSDAAPTDSVDWRILFAEVFDRRGGFDIVVANPPYVRMELFKESKPTLKKNFPFVHSDRSDLYVYFYERAVDLLRDTGALVFISSNKWLRTGYGKRLRSFLGSHLAITHVVDFGDLPVFESASAYPMVLVGFKGVDQPGPTFTQVTNLESPYPDVLELTRIYGNALTPSSVQSDTWQLVRSALTNSSGARGDLTTLVTYSNARVLMGIKTGLNEAFIIGNEVRDQLINSDPGVSQMIKPFVTGRNIRRWNSDPKGTWLIYTFHGADVSRCKRLLAYLQHSSSALIMLSPPLKP